MHFRLEQIRRSCGRRGTVGFRTREKKIRPVGVLRDLTLVTAKQIYRTGYG